MNGDSAQNNDSSCRIQYILQVKIESDELRIATEHTNGLLY